MQAINRFRVQTNTDASFDSFHKDATAALEAFAACPGFLAGNVGRAIDDPAIWLMTMEFETVGAYRRSLSSFDVKMCTPFLATALPEPVGFETLITCEPGDKAVAHESDYSPQITGRSSSND